MKNFLTNLRLFLPLAPVAAILPFVWKPTEPLSQITDLQTSGSAHPILERIRWEDHLQYRASLAPHHEALLKLSEKLTLDQFTALSPEVQIRLATFTENRLNPDHPAMTLCWAPGVSMEVMEAFHSAEEMAAEESPEISAATQFSDGDRWARTSTFNSNLERGEQGLPTTLRWGFMEDGTSIAGFNGEPTSDSDLISFLDSRYGVTSGGGDTPFIESGDNWQYLDDGSNQGTTWRAPGFDDTSWTGGPSQLGYGDGDEATLVGFGGNSSNKHVTTYFRKTFTVANPDDFASFALNFTYDDAVIIYLNGSEVARENISANPAFDDFASGTGSENGTASRTLPPAAFEAGSNTIAVEIHQASRTSSDISFDLNLTGLPDGSSDLTTRPWFSVFEAAFNNISKLTGITYIYEPNDDGASLSNFSRPVGSIGVRGDIRIGGHFVDGDSGSNTLAYNFSPGAGGDMIIDTGNTSFFGNTSSDSLNLRNVVEHEHGHGLGLSHVCPITQTKLMEPFISRRFRGLQLDDIFSLNRLYGDFYEKQDSDRNNDSPENAAVLPVAAGGTFERETLSIDDNADVDFYLLENLPAGTSITVRASPVTTPSGFQEGSQNSDGSCSAGSNFDFTNIHDLALAIVASNGSTILTQADSQPLGTAEEIIAFEAPSTGDYYLRISGGSTDSTQLYTLDVNLSGPPAAPINLTTELANSGEVALSWTDISDNETGFRIERKEETEGSWVTYSSVSANIESFQDPAPLTGTNLFYRIVAIGQISNSPPSETSTIMVVDRSAETYRYDFGQASSPIAPGHIRISPVTRGDITWSDSVSSRDRGGPDPIDRDYLFSENSRTWSHLITNGSWQVAVLQGDETDPRDSMAISAEGILQQDNISPAANEFFETIFIVEIDDGALDLTFEDLGGATNQWVVNRISLTRLSPYQAWVATEQLPDNLDAPEQDADADGIPNIQEFFFGLPPLQQGPAIVITSSISPDGLDSLFTFSKDPAASLEDVIFEASSDLASWAPFTPQPEDISINPQENLDLITLRVPGIFNNAYLRLGLETGE
ncbi:MAG: matrixin family metalloprotease [Akkermansiaceae bacterium]